MDRYVMGMAFNEDGKVFVERKSGEHRFSGKANFPGGRIGRGGPTDKDKFRADWFRRVGHATVEADWELVAVLRQTGQFEVLLFSATHTLSRKGIRVGGGKDILCYTPEEMEQGASLGDAVPDLYWLFRLAHSLQGCKHPTIIYPYNDPEAVR